MACWTSTQTQTEQASGLRDVVEPREKTSHVLQRRLERQASHLDNTVFLHLIRAAGKSKHVTLERLYPPHRSQLIGLRQTEGSHFKSQPYKIRVSQNPLAALTQE